MDRSRFFGATEWALLVGVFSLLFVALCIRTAWGLDEQRLQRDLGVAEDVLTSLCEHAMPHSSHWSVPAQARGVHIPGYGVVFMVEGCVTDERAELLGAGGLSHQSQPRPDSLNQAAVSQLRELGLEFLSTYGWTISQLEEDDHVALFFWPSAVTPSIRIGAMGRGTPLPRCHR